MRTSPHNRFLHGASRSADAVVAAVADNCRFDERASEERWAAPEAMLPRGSAITHTDWAEAYRLYFAERCMVPRVSVPDAFLEPNRNAWLEKIAENQSLVRIEALSRPLQRTALELGELADILQSTDDEARRSVRSFIAAWNQRRDARPAFAAFADEVQAEMEDEDWPHALRDRLGLGHYSATDAAPMPIALMRYSIEEVLAAQTPAVVNAVALPTVLV